jgi:hypothetical protein
MIENMNLADVAPSSGKQRTARPSLALFMVLMEPGARHP